MSTIIPDEIIRCMHIISSYAYEQTSWNKIKAEIMSIIPAPISANFSSCNPSTKELNLNDMEREMIVYWKELTGIELKVMPVEWKIRQRTGRPVGRPRKNPK